jgi:metallophosphoesterase superfamily enzyme
VWIAGNHDPDPREGIGGAFARSLALGPLTFRHEPAAARGQGGQDGANGGGGSNGDCSGEIAGHLHPAARIVQRGRAQTRKCFATDGNRLVMPALGAYTGGLNIRDAAFLKVFGALGFTAHLLGQRRLYSFAAARCLAD